ncbi:hypothetical protein [Demequina activiva]|uniref:Uncharacterized protein n=1 Tax=Demequina activiva TaxID=1582364 RepID=A0A919Q3D1_9MICO|nr:hypothetical protein [Demequina activiva]GIG53568.1 hypothetical protein Dac01nite_03200 [Demequina activiva]
MAQRRRGGGVAALLVLAGAGAAAILWGPSLWSRYGDEVLPSGQCTVTLGDRTDTKTAEQANNIAIIVAGSIRNGLPARAASIAVATALQESSLRNIDYGDRDSVGLFQQRPSQGWGTVEQIMDPYYSTDKFYEGLEKIANWTELEITVAAQAVQRSAFPDAYADHEEEGRLWASALTGNGGDVTCDLGDAGAMTARAFSDRIAADFGEGAYELLVGEMSTETTTLTATAGDATLDAAIQRWAVAVADAEGVVASVDGDAAWQRDEDAAVAAPSDATQISVHTP